MVDRFFFIYLPNRSQLFRRLDPGLLFFSLVSCQFFFQCLLCLSVTVYSLFIPLFICLSALLSFLYSFSLFFIYIVLSAAIYISSSDFISSIKSSFSSFISPLLFSHFSSIPHSLSSTCFLKFFSSLVRVFSVWGSLSVFLFSYYLCLHYFHYLLSNLRLFRCIFLLFFQGECQLRRLSNVHGQC